MRNGNEKILCSDKVLVESMSKTQSFLEIPLSYLSFQFALDSGGAENRVCEKRNYHNAKKKDETNCEWRIACPQGCYIHTYPRSLDIYCRYIGTRVHSLDSETMRCSNL